MTTQYEIFDTVGVAADVLRRAAHDTVAEADMAAAFEARWGSAEDVRKLSFYASRASELPDKQAQTVFDEVEFWERQLIAPPSTDEPYLETCYQYGTAEYDDELRMIGRGPVLLEAPHATAPIRKNNNRRADVGTAGLAAAIASKQMGRAIIARGRQTSDANSSHKHPIKQVIDEEMEARRYRGFLSVHGKRAGAAVHPYDTEEVHAVIGLGRQPQELSLKLTDKVIQRARDELGLRVIVGNFTPQLVYEKNPNYEAGTFRSSREVIKIDEQTGLPKTIAFAASGETTTVTYAQRQHPHVPAAQLEISRSLRYEVSGGPNRGAQVMGVYLGHSLLRITTEVYGTPTAS